MIPDGYPPLSQPQRPWGPAARPSRCSACSPGYRRAPRFMSVTSRRIVMKLGIALPVFFNLPFSKIASASLRVYADGSGDIPVALGEGQRIAYLHLWPHARPFRIAHPEPAMRSVPDAQAVAET